MDSNYINLQNMKLSLPSALFAVVLGVITSAHQVNAGVFPVATNSAQVEFSGGAFKVGSNYLVGFVSGTNVVVQPVSGSGQLIGSPVTMGANPGFPPAVAAAGARTNGLVAWSDQSLSSGVTMFGQLLATTGPLAGTKFPLLASVGSHGFQFAQAAASDGTNFLVVWQDAVSGSFYGQRITASGSLAGAEFFLFNASVQGVGGRNIALGYGGGTYLLAWQGGGNVADQTYVMTISPSGVAGSPVQINATSSVANDPVALAFDGANFLVVWSCSTQTSLSGQENWQLFGRIVATTGMAVGNEMVLAAESATFPALAFDGVNYLVAWGFDTATTNGDKTVHARFVDANANLIGPVFTPFSAAGTNPPLLPLGGVLFDGHQFLLTATYGSFVMSSQGDLMGFAGGDVYGRFLPPSTQLPVFANGAVSNGFFQGQLKVVPGQTYTIETSTNLEIWIARGTMSSDGAERIDLMDPNAVAESGRMFYRAAVGNLVGATFDLHLLEFANAGQFNSGVTPMVSYPVTLNAYSAGLDVRFELVFPAATNVFFTGPAGSGLTAAPANPNNSNINATDAFYQTSAVSAPAAGPGGIWTVNYKGTNLTFNLPDPQAASRLVVPLPTVSVSGDVVQSVSWVYHDATSGAALSSAPAYVTDVKVEIDGLVGGRIYNSPTLTPDITRHVLSSMVNWTNVSTINMTYDDSLGNHYVTFFSKP